MRAPRVSSEAMIATKEKINELRAKQRNCSIQEEECGLKIQKLILQQSHIEDEIVAWEYHLDKLKKEDL